MKTALKVCALCLALAGGNPILWAAGGGGMSSSPMTASQPKKTPQQRAIDSYNQGIRARDKAHQYESKLAELDDQKAISKLQKKIDKQYKRAAKKYRSAIKHEPRLYQAHGSLGYSLKQLGDFEGAMAAYDESLRLRPEYTPAIEYRAVAHLALARLDEVIEAHSHLAYLDHGHQRELEQAIAFWLQETERSDVNAGCYDWAVTLRR